MRKSNNSKKKLLSRFHPVTKQMYVQYIDISMHTDISNQYFVEEYTRFWGTCMEAYNDHKDLDLIVNRLSNC